MAPESAPALYNRALGLMALRRYGEAVTTYERAIQINAENADFWAGKGIALRFLEEYGDALVATQRALELNPTHSQALINQEIILDQMNQPNPTSGN
jgi:tetratricopeptide (TPR) repeat protein